MARGGKGNGKDGFAADFSDHGNAHFGNLNGTAGAVGGDANIITGFEAAQDIFDCSASTFARGAADSCFAKKTYNFRDEHAIAVEGNKDVHFALRGLHRGAHHHAAMPEGEDGILLPAHVGLGFGMDVAGNAASEVDEADVLGEQPAESGLGAGMFQQAFGKLGHGLACLFHVEAQRVELVVLAFLGHEACVIAAFDNATVFHHINKIGTDDSAKTVGDDEGCAALHEGSECLLDAAFGFGVEGGGGFIHEQDGGVFKHGAGDGDALALAAGKAHTMGTDHGVVALGERFNEAVGGGVLSGFLDIDIAGIFAAIGDVGADGVVEQHGFLGYEGHGSAQR